MLFAEERLAQRGGEIEQSLGLVMLKPDHTSADVEYVQANLAENDLAVVWSGRVALQGPDVLALYGQLYSFDADDLVYGVGWKDTYLQYLQSAPSHFFVARGLDAVKHCGQIRDQLRALRGRFSKPPAGISPEDFVERVVKNLVHAADENEMEPTLWLLREFERADRVLPDQTRP